MNFWLVAAQVPTYVGMYVHSDKRFFIHLIAFESVVKVLIAKMFLPNEIGNLFGDFDANTK
jgi:hypothetical protein